MNFTNTQLQAIRSVVDGQHALLAAITGATPRRGVFNQQVENALSDIFDPAQIKYVIENECEHLRFNGWA